MAELFSDEWLRSTAQALPAIPAAERFVVSLTRATGRGAGTETTWTVSAGSVVVVAGAPDVHADLSLTVSPADAAAIVSGDLDPAVAYMQGRLKGAGDMALMLRLVKLGASARFDEWRRVAAVS